MINIDVRIEKQYSSPSENTLNFNTNLDYVPFFLIPKFEVDNKYSYFDISMFSNLNNKFKTNDWDNAKKYLKRERLTKLNNKSILSSIYLNRLKNETSLLNYKSVENNLLRLIDEFDYSINPIKKIQNLSTYYGNGGLTNYFECQQSPAHMSSVKYKNRGNTTYLLTDNGFVATNEGKLNICYALMIKKDYIEEFTLLNLLGEPVDNSKLQWWYNSENTLLSTVYKNTLKKFTKIAKESQFEIIAKENLNCLIKSFKAPKFNTISQVKEFDLILTSNVIKELYNTTNEVPELKLQLNDTPINTVKLKGIRIPKPKVVIPELVD
jgi:hypothetical protein